MKVIAFHKFCEDVVGLNLTLGQRVIAKVVFDGIQPRRLAGEEAELASEMLGGIFDVPTKARRVVVLRLGRGSGKTTISSAWSVYSALTSSLYRCGPGDIPVAVTVAPDKQTAKLSIRMARELIRSSSALNALVVEASDERIDLRRPDGRRVAIEAFAASRGGSSVRGRTILTFLLDEAEFFRSGDSGSYMINDRDVYGALMPRLLPEGRGIFLSTPWPVDTMMGSEFDKNFGNPQTCVAVKATTVQMRGDDHDLADIIEHELERDPDNARREYFCELDRDANEGFFDSRALTESLRSVSGWPEHRNELWPAAAGADFAFKSDSSAICVVQFDGRQYRTSGILELQPRKGSPLKPSEVCGRFAEICKSFGISGVVADGHYREALKEHLQEHGLQIWDAPEGLNGKLEVYTRTKALLHEGYITLPDNTIGRRLVSQAKLIKAKPTPGGGFSIRMPRRTGLAHGDIVSAWTLAVHRLAYSSLGKEKSFAPRPGTEEWFQWTKAREAIADEEREKKYLREANKEVKDANRRGSPLRYLYGR